jgi:hypothetical protein
VSKVESVLFVCLIDKFGDCWQEKNSIGLKDGMVLIRSVSCKKNQQRPSRLLLEEIGLRRVFGVVFVIDEVRFKPLLREDGRGPSLEGRPKFGVIYGHNAIYTIKERLLGACPAVCTTEHTSIAILQKHVEGAANEEDALSHLLK